MYKIIQKRNFLFAFSLAILVPGVVSLFLWGLKPGMDFTGGAKLTLTFPSQPPSGPTVTSLLANNGFKDTAAQTAGDRGLVVRTKALTNDQRQKMLDALTAKYPGVTESAFESFGPTIGAELFRRSVTAIILVLLAIVIYISWAFRRVGIGPVKAWVYGLSAVIALAHDVLIVVGIFSILGHFANIEVDSLFVTALLTVLGFSVHDTIVVFDRIRERLVVGHEQTFEDTVNVSLNQTLVRSLNTSLTTLLVLTALFLFGGATIRNFVLALLIGIASGTYSSIFVASPLLVVYERWRARR